MSLKSFLFAAVLMFAAPACVVGAGPDDDSKDVRSGRGGDDVPDPGGEPTGGGDDWDPTDPGQPCCDPALEPGTGDNPHCFEGSSCCADGAWACNDGEGSPSCDLCE